MSARCLEQTVDPIRHSHRTEKSLAFATRTELMHMTLDGAPAAVTKMADSRGRVWLDDTQIVFLRQMPSLDCRSSRIAPVGVKALDHDLIPTLTTALTAGPRSSPAVRQSSLPSASYPVPTTMTLPESTR